MGLLGELFGLLGQYFESILVILVIATGIISVVDKVYFAKGRANKVNADKTLADDEKEKKLKAPWVADYSRSLFLVFFIVLLLRSFIAEPYKIPSGSMLPTLKIGDFILVNKFAYGLRMPVWHTTLVPVGHPKRGDVVVFRFPANPSINFIKRLIGVPGDTISYTDKTLYINGKKMPKAYLGHVLEPANSNTASVTLFNENLMPVTHDIYNNPWQPKGDFYNVKVPKGQYLVMGDNRDDSEDSRYWGFVSEKYFVGKAFIVWMSWDSSSHSLLPVRWSRIGRVIH